MLYYTIENSRFPMKQIHIRCVLISMRLFLSVCDIPSFSKRFIMLTSKTVSNVPILITNYLFLLIKYKLLYIFSAISNNFTNICGIIGDNTKILTSEA